MVPLFKDRLQTVNPNFEIFASLQTLQVNLGNLCNLHCHHCHVKASSRGTEVMGGEVIEQIAAFLARHPHLTLDITGGCPEMNPNFRFLIESTEGLAAHRFLRSNLAIMAEPGWEWLPEYCRQQDLTIIGSLPCYLEENVDGQRGQGVYRKSIEVLKQLNTRGYGRELELNLVYNPGGGFIPGRQQELEAAYKEELLVRHGIVFNHLFTITNAPIGRFRDHLEATGTYTNYLQLLAGRFNPDAAENIMCRTLISVDWQGKLYNCDFNQALGMAITAADGSEIYLAELDDNGIDGKKIRLSEHCYCCTAGEGSSCTGALLA
jgi:radical SAM/Cys-rich protein